MPVGLDSRTRVAPRRGAGMGGFDHGVGSFWYQAFCDQIGARPARPDPLGAPGGVADAKPTRRAARQPRFFGSTAFAGAPVARDPAAPRPPVALLGRVGGGILPRPAEAP